MSYTASLSSRLFLVVGLAVALESARADELPAYGCPMAHCDRSLSDLVRLPVPAAPVRELWRSEAVPGEQAGSYLGLGCSGNGFRAACTYAGPSDNLVTYDSEGHILWRSGDLLRAAAYASAPIVLVGGDVIACDDRYLIRFDGMGRVRWSSPLPAGGVPVSPVLTASGVLVLATYRGPIYAFDAASGALLAQQFLRKAPGDQGFFETANTPAVSGNRIYLSTRYRVGGAPDPERTAWLVALELDLEAPTFEERLKLRWHFPFGEGGRASPLVVGSAIFFDADRPAPGAERNPHIFAVYDAGSYAFELWRRPANGSPLASFALDPRPAGGFWSYNAFNPWLIRWSVQGGMLLQAINLDLLVGEPVFYAPFSAMTIGGSSAEPVMLIGATAFGRGTAYLIALDLVSGTLRWKVPVSDIGWPYALGQFPLLLSGGEPRVVFTTATGGARAVGSDVR